MKKIYIGLFWACILGITGCYEDDSTMATPESMVNEIRSLPIRQPSLIRQYWN